MSSALYLVVLLSFAFQEKATPAPRASMCSAAGLHEDVELLRRAFEELHPGLQRYTTSAERDARFAALHAAFDREQTLTAAFLTLSAFLAQIRCGHTHVNPFNQSASVANELFERAGRVPFRFRWLARRMIVTRNFSTNAALAPGAEVRTIEGVPVGEILARLLTIARADGANDAKRVSLLEVRGLEDFEAFDVYLSLFYPALERGFELEVVPPGVSAAVRVQVASETEADRRAQRAADEKARGAGALPFETRTLAPGVAYLRMSSWALYDSDWDWSAYLDTFFDRLVDEGTRALVVDLRGNEGGLDVGDALLARVIAAPLARPGFVRHVRYRKVSAELAPHLDTWDRSFFDWGAAALGPEEGFYRLQRASDVEDDLLQPRGKRFAGQLVVLVDAANSSATFEFELALQRAHLGTLLGQPTGGNRRGINGGAFFFLRLPHSGLEVDLPLIGQFPLTDEPDAGLVPDVLVEPTSADIAADTDVELAAALRLLER